MCSRPAGGGELIAGLAGLLAVLIPDSARETPATVDLALTALAAIAAIVRREGNGSNCSSGRLRSWPCSTAPWLNTSQREDVRDDVVSVLRRQDQVRHRRMGRL